MAQPQPHPAPSSSQLSSVASSIRNLLHQPDYDDGSAGPILVRLAWHASGTYCAQTNTGGSNGAGMRYELEGGDPANAGLQHARTFLEPIKRAHPFLTYSDLWTLASVIAIKEMGGPTISWNGGRTDFTDESKIPPRGRLPDGAKGPDHLRFIFNRMGFNDQEIVALSGAHNLGRCHADRSGFEGKWVNNPTRFSNSYFKLLLGEDWRRKRFDSGVEQFVNFEDDEEGELMMLPSDVALIEDPGFRPWVELYAERKDVFFDHFARVFAKLLELGIEREGGRVVNEENLRDGYVAAPKKSDAATAGDDQNDGQVGHEAKALKEENEKRVRRVGGAKL